MAIVLFILGLPGSGKSTAARHIVDYVQLYYQDKGWSTKRLNDYEILHRMAWDDLAGKRFSLTKLDGFDVLDPGVLGVALRGLKKRVVEEMRSGDKRKLVIVEFARIDYSRALKRFFSEFLKDAFFLFIDADIPVCLQRIEDRVAKPLDERSKDDHYVSPFIFETYYERDKRRYPVSVAAHLQKGFGVAESHVKVIEDSCLTLDKFHEQVELFIESILQPEFRTQPKSVKIFFRSKHPTGDLAYKISHTRTNLSGILL